MGGILAFIGFPLMILWFFSTIWGWPIIGAHHSGGFPAIFGFVLFIVGCLIAHLEENGDAKTQSGDFQNRQVEREVEHRVNHGVVRSKEIITEKEVIVKIRCPYCRNLYDETLDRCPNCGGMHSWVEKG